MLRGLTKNLAQTTGKSFSRRSNSSQSQSRHRGDTFNKYQSTGYSNPSKSQSTYQGPRSKKRAFSSPSPEGTSARLSECSVLENPYIGPTDSLICFRLQDKFPQNSFSKVSRIYPNIGSGGTNTPGSERVIAKRALHKTPHARHGFLKLPVSCIQKGRIFASVDRHTFFEQVHCKRAFPHGKPQLLNNVAFTRDFMTNIFLKDAYFSVPVHEYSRSSLTSFGREHVTSSKLFHSACVQPPEFSRKF